jgi:DNA replication protein DnaC
MVNESTLNKLHELRLSAMATAYRQQLQETAMSTLSFSDRFGLLVDHEWDTRKNSRLKRLVRKADFPISGACMEDIEYITDRKLNKEQLLQLSTCSYINDKRNIIILGATGAGKTFLACALGMAACRHFFSVKYIRLPDLLDELSVARGEGVFRKVMHGYKNLDLLILDEWLLIPLSAAESRDLLEITESRYMRCSTIFSSQFDVSGWHTKILEAALSEAVLDRIVHNSYPVIIGGEESMRKRRGVS